MPSAVIVDAVRTPIGKRFGSLSGWHPAELVAVALRNLAERSGVDPSLVEDVIMGCVTQVGPQSTNIARTAVLAAGWPEQVPGTTVDRQCGSSQQAVHFAAQGVMAGAYDIVVAAGIESMTTVPMFSNAAGDLADVYGDVVADRYENRENYGQKGIIQQGISAEILAEKWDLTRDVLDAFSLESHRRAAAARDSGYFKGQLVPVEGKRRDREDRTLVTPCEPLRADEGIKDTSLDRLAELKPAFLPSGRITAGNSSQISDGAAAVLIMSEDRARSLGLRPMARFVGFSVVGSDPIEMLTGPIPATNKLLDRAGLAAEDIDLFEVNEAFAPVPLVWSRELGVPLDRVNVNGGAIALGHPLGASGARLMVTLVHELARRGGRYGVETICEGGGMANACLIEAIS
jgi:acetyl-CoA acyltransferase